VRVPRLYLLRHAKSSWDDVDLADRDRPLARRGRVAADRLASYAALEGIRPQLVLCSPARRTRETLDALLGALAPDASVAYEERLYMADARGLIERLRLVPEETRSVLVVGHNPGIEQLLVLLAGHEAERRIGDKLPTGALATLELDGDWATLERARLVDYVVPRELR
jgi:phosphohistidine phosphatase